MSTAAEVRAASIATTSSDDRKPSAGSSVQDVRHSVAKDGHSSNKDRHPVVKDRAEKLRGRSSPKPDDEKPVQRKTSEVQFVKQSYSNAKLVFKHPGFTGNKQRLNYNVQLTVQHNTITSKFVKYLFRIFY